MLPSPSSPSSLATTGATGRIGGMVARHLADAGIPQRLVLRRPDAAPSLPGATIAAASYGDADAARAALEGITTVFMVSGSESADRVDQHRTFIDAAAAAGVAHVVYLSFLGAAPDASFHLARDHWATEQHLRVSGMAWTALRDSLYAEALPMMVGDDGVLRGPAGRGRVAAVAQSDVAGVAATVLRDPAAHVGRTYDLTGPVALTLDEVAVAITDVTGRPTTYVEETLEEARASRAHHDVPEWLVEAWISTYTAIAAGEMAAVSDAVQRLTGQPPTPLQVAIGGH